MFFDRPNMGTRVLLAAIQPRWRPGVEDPDELRELARAAGASVVGIMAIALAKPDVRTYLTKGKLEALTAEAIALDADAVVVSEDLSPSQERNLEKVLERRVICRTELIIDIFGQRARTHEGKLQVELAQLRHMTTRLVRGWTHLDRQKGGVGMRGAGETQLELDQRIISDRIRHAQEQLERVRSRRALGRRNRQRHETATIALVGYTNAGKSTLFNQLAEASVFATDMLFATLDPTMRRVHIPRAGDVVLADTVGFIRRLPHRLVDAFKATLEEVREATLLLHVMDAASEFCAQQQAEVESVLQEIGAADLPRIEVMNKIDLLADGAALAAASALATIAREPAGAPDPGTVAADAPAVREPRRVWISARSGLGLPALRDAIAAQLAGEEQCGTLTLRPDQGRLRAWLYAEGVVGTEQVDSEGRLHLQVKLSRDQVAQVEREHGTQLSPS